MSKTSIKKIDAVSNSRVCIHSFLIGQLGVSDNYAQNKPGILLLDDAFTKIKMVHDLVAGRYILVDAVNNEKVIELSEQLVTRFLRKLRMTIVPSP